MGDSQIVTVTDPRTCGMGVAVGVFEGKWKAFIMWVLADGPRRFGETRRLVTGISEKVLTQQLRELEADGIVRREDHDEVPPRVDYSLTEHGHRLYELLELLDAWGQDHLTLRSTSVTDKGLGAPPTESPRIAS